MNEKELEILNINSVIMVYRRLPIVNNYDHKDGSDRTEMEWSAVHNNNNINNSVHNNIY